MKHTIYALVLLIFGTTYAQKKPTEVKKETEVKTVTYKNGKDTKEGKVKVISKETANVRLDANDANKVNQDRMPATKKVETTVMVDKDSDKAYDIITKDSYFVNMSNNYKFSPNNSGFDITHISENHEFVSVGKAWNSYNPGTYIISGKEYDGIGYFDKDGNFIIEYYDESSNSIKSVTFNEKIERM
ncbi:hypothetical protein CLV33_10664 [Jejuia pallidilutea]|uniref:Uncharacterized protein n=1 Tax=Jejuia pallidilutea TaxID=504487 RepID=A0A362WZY6_9FLAO|nr:hypothetical protein [Jejuia pallidilutea]PQV47745.1 hypothetical protein CLV33_10664 [Jejuia pallidilutea]